MNTPPVLKNSIRVNRKSLTGIESHAIEYQLLEGQGHVFSFTTGYQFTLSGHPRRELNAKYVLRWVSHSLSLTHYTNAFQAFPAHFSFRAPITTPKPKIISPQTAIVTGPPGEEIYSDQYGRIKIQFHWDQEGQYDDKSSCWIRVSQISAGQGWGNLWIPRIGQEVVVSFLNGDPDMPLVIGNVYNAQQQPPYKLPDEQTKSSIKSNSSKGGGGFNEIRFEDKAGSEELFIHAQKDLNQVVKNDLSQEVKNDKSISIGRHLMEQVKGAVTSLVIGQLTKTVIGNITKLFQANVQKMVLGSEVNVTALNLNQEVGGNYVLKVKGDVTIEASGKVTIKGAEIHLNP
ncbi:hypothetical protein THII_3603 [Thioploca ingrica]|uniref:Uncharacterized protein n=1 Tax=Thioploca ingrica TaxID=40754 RepID=A0A090AQJ0_9GAMM|nr:hypothetical protein THII_3603 [Thioploca ingrica]